MAVVSAPISPAAFRALVGLFVLIVASFLGVQFWIQSHTGGLNHFPWDLGWYLKVLQEGYQYAPDGKQHSLAFLPGQVLVTEFMGDTLALRSHEGFYVTGFLCAFFGCLYLFKLLHADYGTLVAWGVLLLTLTNPFSFFLFSGYPESLVFLCVAACLYYVRMSSGLWKAGLFAGVAGATHVFGQVLVAVFIVALLGRLRMPRRNALVIPALFFGVAGLGGLIWHSQASFDTPFAYVDAQQAWFAQQPPFGFHFMEFVGLTNVYSELKHLQLGELLFSRGGGHTVALASLQFLVILSLLLLGGDRLKAMHAVFVWAALFAYLYATHAIPAGMMTSGRHLLLLFPVWIVPITMSINAFPRVSLGRTIMA